MKCFHCGAELIIGGNHDYELSDLADIVTNLSCPACDTFVLVYHSFEDDQPNRADT